MQRERWILTYPLHEFLKSLKLNDSTCNSYNGILIQFIRWYFNDAKGHLKDLHTRYEEYVDYLKMKRLKKDTIKQYMNLVMKYIYFFYFDFLKRENVRDSLKEEDSTSWIISPFD